MLSKKTKITLLILTLCVVALAVGLMVYFLAFKRKSTSELTSDLMVVVIFGKTSVVPSGLSELFAKINSNSVVSKSGKIVKSARITVDPKTRYTSVHPSQNNTVLKSTLDSAFTRESFTKKTYNDEKLYTYTQADENSFTTLVDQLNNGQDPFVLVCDTTKYSNLLSSLTKMGSHFSDSDNFLLSQCNLLIDPSQVITTLDNNLSVDEYMNKLSTL